MKKTIALCILFCFSYVFLMSCRMTEKNVDNAIRFDTLQITKTYHFLNDTLNPSCNLQVLFVYPDSADKKLLIFLQNIFIEKTFDDSFIGLSPKKALDAYLEQYIQVFSDFETQLQTESSNGELDEDVDCNIEYKDDSALSYYSIIRNAIVYNQNQLLSFTVETIGCEGGAHSSKSIFGYSIDLINKRLLVEDDFAEVNYKQHLSLLIATKIAEANGIDNPKDLENLGYFGVEDMLPNNNFTLDEKGITYYFNENEIAGTMLGLTCVFIPYSEISVFLKEENPVTPFMR